jgi:hypothetical protein
VSAKVCGPVEIQVGSFRKIVGEVAFLDMEPRGGGYYEPLIGYAILELAGIAIDMVSHRLLARKFFDAKGATA